MDVALDADASKAFLVDDAGCIDPSWLEDVWTIGLTSGASVPAVLVKEVVATLEVYGFDDIEERSEVDERVVFGLPPIPERMASERR